MATHSTQTNPQYSKGAGASQVSNVGQGTASQAKRQGAGNSFTGSGSLGQDSTRAKGLGQGTASQAKGQGAVSQAKGQEEGHSFIG